MTATFAQASVLDKQEALLAYRRYHRVLCGMAYKYDVALSRVVAAFVSLSPNTDYLGNLRSTVSVLEGIQKDYPVETIVTSGYYHCRDRAYAYARGDANFETRTKGLKVLNFYHNLLDPEDPKHVTVDGHVVGAWRGLNLTMREAQCSRSEYLIIKHIIFDLSKERGLIPNQYQATIWFTRKRLLNKKYVAQLGLFQDEGDRWDTFKPVEELKPYPRRI